MTTNPFNICPTCDHVKTCVLTEMKEQVWSCSEYDEVRPEPFTDKQSKAKTSIGFGWI